LVSEDTIVSDVFSTIFDILNSNAYQATDSAGDTVTLSKTDSGNYWTGSFPRRRIKDKSIYPIGVINTPEFSEDIRGFRWTEQPTTTRIAVHATRSEHPPLFAQKALKSLRDNISNLEDEGLNKLETGRSTADQTVRGDLQIHTYIIPIELTYNFEVS